MWEFVAFRVPTAIRLVVRIQKIKAFARQDEYRNLKTSKKKGVQLKSSMVMWYQYTTKLFSLVAEIDASVTT